MKSRNHVDVQMGEVLVGGVVVDQNRRARSAKRNQSGRAHTRNDRKELVTKIRSQTVKRRFVAYRADQDLPRIRGALLECRDDEDV